MPKSGGITADDAHRAASSFSNPKADSAADVFSSLLGVIDGVDHGVVGGVASPAFSAFSSSSSSGVRGFACVAVTAVFSATRGSAFSWNPATVSRQPFCAQVGCE